VSPEDNVVVADGVTFPAQGVLSGMSRAHVHWPVCLPPRARVDDRSIANVYQPSPRRSDPGATTEVSPV